jgi:hypothetical protein
MNVVLEKHIGILGLLVAWHTRRHLTVIHVMHACSLYTTLFPSEGIDLILAALQGYVITLITFFVRILESETLPAAAQQRLS